MKVKFSLNSDGSDNFPPFELLKNTVFNVFRESGMAKEKMEDTIISLWATVHGLAAITTMQNVCYGKTWKRKIERYQLIIYTVINKDKFMQLGELIMSRDTVLITGASSGIGDALAKVFASHKYNLILVARNAKKLNELADKLRNQHNIRIDVIAKDLSQAGSAKKVFDDIINMKLTVEILVNNAGVGNVGFFHETELNRDTEMIQLNIGTLTELTKLFSREMVKRNKGKILNVGSTGSFAPGPFIAVYYATKAYVLSFSRAISKELKPYGVTVTTLCPGAVRTNFCKTAGKRDMPGAMEAGVVAEAAYRGLLKNKKVVIPGILNKILVRLPQDLVSNINFKNQQKLFLKTYRE